MSGPLRPGPSGWRRAATVVLAGRTRLPALLLRRSASQGFMPGAHVFPWRRLLAPTGARPPGPRAAFEEAGVLLLRPRGAPPAPAPAPGRALDPPPGLDAWRERVRRDARRFLHLCAHLDCAPDVWALHAWGGWRTPFSRGLSRRFDTAFFLCCLREPPPVLPDAAEVVGCQWLSPSEATHSFLSKEIWLAPPQFYELRRLENFASLSDLHKFCLDGALEGLERWLPVTLVTADGMLQLLPGDELYVEDADSLEEVLSTEKKTEEIMKEGKKFHRIVMYNKYLYNLHVTISSENKHIYPKNYVVGASRL
uniref:Acyl-coenzyme A diphosphatase NUDT19 n=1 Tax=Microcebus murinus TaxID=30608 RepID=A0A8C5XME6_MICMU